MVSRPPAWSWKALRSLPESRLAFVLPLTVYLALSTAGALTRLPFSDEGWFTIPAYQAAHHGAINNPVVVPSRSHHERFDRWYVLQPPFHFIEVAAAFRVLGASVPVSRFPSTLWGAILVVALFFALRGLGPRPPGAALLAATVLSADFSFLASAASARPDLPCMAAGLTGLAVYTVLRPHSRIAALLLGNGLVALGGLIHPNGLAAAGLMAVLLFVFERRHVDLRAALAALLPYAAAAIVLVWHLLHDVEGLTTRVAGNLASQRALGGAWLPRYAEYFGLAELGSGSALVKAVPLAVFALVLVLAVPSTTWASRRMRAALLWVCTVNIFFLVLITPSKGAYYMVFFTAPLSLLAGVWLADQLSRSPRRRALAVVLVVALLSAQLARTGARIARDDYHRRFLPVVQFLLQASEADDLVYASREFFVSLAPDRPMLDDYYYGAKTGRYAEWVVVEKASGSGLVADETRLALVPRAYNLAFSNGTYAVYRLDRTRADRASTP